MRLPALMLFALLAPLIGCATTMQAPAQTDGQVADRLQMDTRPRVVDGNPLPLRFAGHGFAVHVYDTLAFYVEYNGTGWFSDQYRTARSPGISACATGPARRSCAGPRSMVWSTRQQLISPGSSPMA